MARHQGRPTSMHPCPGGCAHNIHRGLFACRPCWQRLPLQIRDRITYGYARRASHATEHRQAMAEGSSWFRLHPAGSPS